MPSSIWLSTAVSHAPACSTFSAPTTFARRAPKALTENAVYFHHALRNALLPVITIIGLQFGNMLAGAIVVETVFNWPGLGRLAFDSVLRRDYPTLLGLLFFSSLMVIVANQVTEIFYRLADSRIRT